MTVLLSTPLQGWVAPLQEVDDPVFAQKMAGDGVAIDPTGSTVFAPCDAEILSVAPTRHAVTLRGPYGIEILIHVGLDTVLLGGEGFRTHVSAGKKVKVGERLLSFDMDLVGRRAKSLLTPVLVTNLDAFQLRWRQEGRDANVGDPLMQAWAKVRTTGPSSAEPISERRLILGLDEGLHARPSARIGSLIQPYTAEVHLEVRGRKANAKNLISLMTLQAGPGDQIRLVATGRDRDRALNALAVYLEAGSPGVAPAVPWEDDRAVETAEPAPGSRVIRGSPAAPGQATGPAFQLRRRPLAALQGSKGPVFEKAALELALDGVRDDLVVLSRSPDVGGEIMAAHQALLDDPDLRASADQLILDGQSASAAWSGAVTAQATRLEALDQPHLRARVLDLTDLRRRVLIRLDGAGPAHDQWEVGEGSVLVADDLSPSELLGLKDRISGLCLAKGGPTSHVAIIAASLNLPAIVGAGDAILAIPDGAPLLVDGDRGELVLDPTPAEQARAGSAGRALAQSASLSAEADLEPCRLADGVRIEIFANLAGAAGAPEALSLGAEGCGLLRTEFLFMDRAEPPSEAEQRAVYQGVLDALSGRPLTIRTFDFGGDKPLPFLSAAREDNPALGLRGIRTSLRRPDLLRPQLRAILQVVPAASCRILLPMVTSVEEVIAVAAMLEEERQALGLSASLKLGVMIETPAAALATAAIGAHADFFSLGTNDLTQYTLATDRTHAVLSGGVDPLHPAVLRLMALACDGAIKAGRPVSVCGAVGSDPLAAPLLIGLGVTQLSASPAAIPSLKAAIARLSMRACSDLAEQAGSMTSAGEIHALLAAAAETTGLETVS